jgi:hypothetical protein
MTEQKSIVSSKSRARSKRTEIRLLRARLFALLIACLAFTGFALADPPATQPADNALTVGAADPVVDATPERLAHWFNQLDDPDATVRVSAFDKLMCLKSTDLDMLKDVVKKALPLRPGQASVLPGIVKQVYLSGMDYDGDVALGFMGVSLIDRDGVQFVNPQFNNLPPQGIEHVGIMIGHCMPGFGGGRTLRDGDVVLSIMERPDVKLDSTTIFATTIRDFGAGKTVHLLVLRQAHILRVPVTLDPHPNELQNQNGVPVNPEVAVQQMASRRDDAADDYWSRDFAPLFKQGPS